MILKKLVLSPFGEADLRLALPSPYHPSLAGSPINPFLVTHLVSQWLALLCLGGQTWVWPYELHSLCPHTTPNLVGFVIQCRSAWSWWTVLAEPKPLALMDHNSQLVGDSVPRSMSELLVEVLRSPFFGVFTSSRLHWNLGNNSRVGIVWWCMQGLCLPECSGISWLFLTY